MARMEPELHENVTIATKTYRHRTTDTPHTVNSHDMNDLVTDHIFIAPYEICAAGIGLLSILVNRHIIDASFSKLYQLSLRLGWEKVFTQERQKLKPNDISVMKCFVLNRLLQEYLKDSHSFVKRSKTLYNEIKSRMSTDFPQWTSQNLFEEVKRWQDMQRRRRLFYFNHTELRQLPGLLMLHKAATNWCHCLINHFRQNTKLWETEGRNRFTEHFQHSFIIVAQPTGSEGAAATQYIKSTTGHFAKLNTRIICLLDPVILKDYIDLSTIDVTLYPLNRETNDKKEKQLPIKWQIQKVMSAEGTPVSIFYAEVNTLQLGTHDSESKRLPLNSTLCQLEFRWKIKINDPEYEENIVLLSQPFGICSHAQYFPKFVAQIFLHEMKQILNHQNTTTDPNIITEFIRRYYTRMTGVELTDHTNRYIREVFAKAIDDVKSTRTMNTLDNTYEDLLAKMISQIDFLVLHPVLSLMYDDSLFLGICNSTEVDKMLNGTREEPHLLLRFNTLTNHQWNSNAIVQFIIHDGNLKRASFDTKTFANEMCRLICESMSDKIKPAKVLSTMSPRIFTDFQWYFHEELYRLNKMSLPSSDSYDPLLPILWMTMRQNDSNNPPQTSTVSNNSIQRKKRNYSDLLPTIESVSSEVRPIPINVIVHVNSIDDNLLQQNTSSNDFHRSMIPHSRIDVKVGRGEKIDQSDNPKGAKKNRQWVVEMPDDTDISPAVIFSYLSEKFRNLPDNQNEHASSNNIHRANQGQISSSNMIYCNGSKRMKSPINNSSNIPSEISKVDLDPVANVGLNNTQNQIQIKQEPCDVDYAILTDTMLV
ncbi:unnamed protein product [Adineta steineri]|uniref:Uncharacterized protein n=1 Tax=Adineta steineri TaxID=433720 RepID=A0A813XBW7_9BILA|nr:unnamed protein product [Adineta steineri]CAF1235478.1 unnamed protein product [Adineta steineri]